MNTTATSTLRGGEFLLTASDPSSVFTPEQRTDEHRMIGDTVRDFVNHEVLPVLDRLEQKDWALARELVRRGGELGIMGADVAEEYGGLALDKVSSVVISEQISLAASFGATFGAHANLVVLPLSLFGTEQQKRTYLPKLLSGEMVGAYCLSEPGSGSDALGAKARATRQPDGSFVLNGEKMWITNGGFADVFIIFAKVDGDQFTAFIVERAFGGLTSGKEEHKMGLHGSSTTPIILQDVKVPAGNLLGEVGKGHKIAFNVLNFARYKLGAMCGGAAQGAIGEAAKYAATRKQFGQPIATFGAITHKLGEMVVRAYAIESLVYRTAGLIDSRIAASPHPPTDMSVVLSAVEEYAVEASIAKVAGSETLDFALDENIQIHGGNGYVSDYPAERHYRDSRVNRIFEGTNEINRLLIPGMLARRAVKGDLGIIAAAKALQDELLGPPSLPTDDGSALAEETRAVHSFKKASLMVLGLAMQTYREKLADQQEVLMHLADMIIDTFSAESALLRAAANGRVGATGADLQADAARVFVNDAAMRIEMSAKQALAAMLDGDTLRTTIAGLRRLFRQMPVNTAVLRRRLAEAAVARGGYVF
ncbi:MAG TPA: acyl-CoA dehydrogenase family protein [Vicinamibacterales bacterium]|nr:acyl-CoA dehydrogenase family protein [Vicinamibacterales bacterium]